MATKIDVLNFTKPQMTARLLIIARNWSRQSDDIVLNQIKATSYVKKVVKENFIYPTGKLEQITRNLLLFLLGNDNNIFTKAIK